MARTRTQVAGRTAVITGAGSGIGRALAQHLSERGCPVAICDWNEDDLRETEASLRGPVFARKLDVRDRQGQLAFAAQAREWAPAPFSMVVNNAGVTVSQDVLHGSVEDDEWLLDVNLWGVVHGVRAWLPALVEQGDGAIVNVSSVFGLVGWPTQAMYCASKHAVRGYTESLRHELRDTRVRAVSVHPGGIATRIVEHARFHVDDLGGTDRSVLEQEFTQLARTSPADAAKTIVGGVEAGRDRILIGPDAYAIAAVSRALPVRYFDALRALTPLLSRGKDVRVRR